MDAKSIGTDTFNHFLVTLVKYIKIYMEATYHSCMDKWNKRAIIRRQCLNIREHVENMNSGISHVIRKVSEIQERMIYEKKVQINPIIMRIEAAE